ncbi:MAG: hypothetical protein ACK55I_17265, partial [bacterium]
SLQTCRHMCRVQMHRHRSIGNLLQRLPQPLVVGGQPLVLGVLAAVFGGGHPGSAWLLLPRTDAVELLGGAEAVAEVEQVFRVPRVFISRDDNLRIRCRLRLRLRYE